MSTDAGMTSLSFSDLMLRAIIVGIIGKVMDRIAGCLFSAPSSVDTSSYMEGVMGKGEKENNGKKNGRGALQSSCWIRRSLRLEVTVFQIFSFLYRPFISLIWHKLHGCEFAVTSASIIVSVAYTNSFGRVITQILFSMLSTLWFSLTFSHFSHLQHQVFILCVCEAVIYH